MGLTNFLKSIFRELNKRGVSATVMGIILLIVGLAILLVLIISIGKTGSESISGISNSLENVKHGGI